MILLLLALQTQVTGSISGVVRNFAGEPVFDAVVSIADATRRARSDSLGQYRLDAVPVGRVHMMAWGLGYETKQVDTALEAGQELHVDFSLLARTRPVVIPAGSVSGTVRDTSGHPLPHAVVLVNGASHAPADTLGQYRIDSVPAGAVHITVSRLGFVVAHLDTVLRDRQQLRADFVLHEVPIVLHTVSVGVPVGSVIGVVRDTAGHPVSSAMVSVGGRRASIADSLGHYRIDSVPAGAVHLAVRRLGYHVATVDTTLEAGQQLHVDFVLRALTLKLPSVVPASATVTPMAEAGSAVVR